jgi:hypothetical protein
LASDLPRLLEGPLAAPAPKGRETREDPRSPRDLSVLGARSRRSRSANAQARTAPSQPHESRGQEQSGHSRLLDREF